MLGPFDAELNNVGTRGATVLKITNGSITFRKKRDSRNLPSAIDTPNGMFVFNRIEGFGETPKEIQVQNNRGNILLAVTAGSGKWIKDDISQDLQTGDFANIDGNSGQILVSQLPGPSMIVSPDPDDNFFPGFMKRGFNVVWQAMEGTSEYTIRLFDEIGTRQISLNEWYQSETNGIRIQNLPEGKYWIQAAPLNSQGLTGLWSDMLPFTIGGRVATTETCNNSTTPEITAKFVPFQEHNMLAGCVNGADPTQYNIIIYALTDVWWIQPLADNFQIPVAHDGYFESYINVATELYIMLVDKNFDNFPETITNRDGLPKMDNQFVISALTLNLR
jgi:hypothetical protein